MHASKLLGTCWKILTKITIAVMVVIFCVACFCDGWNYSIRNNCNFLTILIATLFTLVAFWIFRNSKKISDRQFYLYSIILFVFYAILIVLVAYFLYVYPDTWDPSDIVWNAARLSNKEPLNDYFEIYPFQFFLTFCTAKIVQILYLIGINRPVTELVLALNMCVILLTIFFTYLASIRIFGKKRALSMLALSPPIFLPLILYTPIYYSDTTSALFVAIELFIISTLLIPHSKSEALYWSKIVLLGIVSFVGMKLKVTSLIIVIAFIIWLACAITKNNILRKVVSITCIAIILLGCSLAWGVIQQHYAPNTEKTMPLTHWLKMGVHGYGAYNSQDRINTSQALADGGESAAKQENINSIKEALQSYGLLGYLKFLGKKIAFTWGDGTYYAPAKLSRHPCDDTNIFYSIFASDGDNVQLFITFSAAIRLVTLCIIAVGIIISPHRDTNLIQILGLAIVGVFIFFLFWETRSRYLINTIPITTILFAYYIQKIRYEAEILHSRHKYLLYLPLLCARPHRIDAKKSH